jgi:hypothetical protein
LAKSSGILVPGLGGVSIFRSSLNLNLPPLHLRSPRSFLTSVGTMNCPSRTDEVDWNPGWNQNPPFLAADLTTCQDLNGMINARELNKSDSRAGTPWDESRDDAFQARIRQPRPESPRPAFIGWAWWILSVFCTSFVFSNIDAFKLTNISPFFNAFFRRGSTGQYRSMQC